jgi:hypothetical protein
MSDPFSCKKEQTWSKVISTLRTFVTSLKNDSGCWWLTPVIPVTQEAVIRRIMVWSQPRKIVHETLSQKNPSQERTGTVAQDVGLEFKSQYYKKKKVSGVNLFPAWIQQLRALRWLFFNCFGLPLTAADSHEAICTEISANSTQKPKGQSSFLNSSTFLSGGNWA